LLSYLLHGYVTVDYYLVTELKKQITLNIGMKSELDTRNAEVTVLERKLKEAINASVALDK
jgi:hypothetical protein